MEIRNLPPRRAGHGNLPELLLISLHELRERSRQSLGVRITHDDPIVDLEEKLLTAAALRVGIGVGHVEANVENHLVGRRVKAIRVGINRAQLALIEHDLNLLLLGLVAGKGLAAAGVTALRLFGHTILSSKGGYC